MGGATLTGDLPPSCISQTQTQVVLQVQFCSKRDYDICGLEPPEEPRASNTGEFDEFPVVVGPPAVLGPEFPILEPDADIPTGVIPKVPTERPPRAPPPPLRSPHPPPPRGTTVTALAAPWT